MVTAVLYVLNDEWMRHAAACMVSRRGTPEGWRCPVRYPTGAHTGALREFACTCSSVVSALPHVELGTTKWSYLSGIEDAGLREVDKRFPAFQRLGGEASEVLVKAVKGKPNEAEVRAFTERYEGEWAFWASTRT